MAPAIAVAAIPMVLGPFSADFQTASPPRRLRRFQFTLGALLSVMVVLNVIIAASVLAWNSWRESTDPTIRDFCREISSADRIVVRDGVSDPAHDERILIEVVNRDEIAEVRKRLELRPDDAFDTWYGHDHICYGYLGIDWYRGDARVAQARLMDGVLHCEGNPHLTRESATWLRQWLSRHGLSGKYLELTVPSR